MGIAHPSVIEIALTTRQRLDKGAHGLPCAIAQALGALRANRDERLPHLDVTGMLNGILILLHEIAIDRATHGGDAHGSQRLVVTLRIHSAKLHKKPHFHKFTPSHQVVNI